MLRSWRFCWLPPCGCQPRLRGSSLGEENGLWDHTGNPLKKVENWGGLDYPTTYRYDRVYRLTEDTRRDPNGNPNFSLLYGYDQVGNRTSRTKGGTTVTYSYDDNDKLVSASDGSSFGYDGSGDMTSVSGPLGSWSLVYDDESRPTSITHPSGGGSGPMTPTPNGATRSRHGWQAIMDVASLGLTSVWLGVLLKTAATFRTVYATAAMRRPLLLEIVGREPWVVLAGVVACEVVVAVAAWRSRRPSYWLTVEVVVMAALVTILTPVLAASAYRPLQELLPLLRK